jgi:hypothetical protein
MTDQIEIGEPVARHSHLILEALLDGERVDPAELKEALADPAARDHFVDLLTLREAVGRLDAIVLNAARNRGVGSAWRPKRLAAAAAIVLASLTTGYFVGQRVLAQSIDPPTVEAVVELNGAPPAPQPTRSIALTPGVNWTDSPGGR